MLFGPVPTARWRSAIACSGVVNWWRPADARGRKRAVPVLVANPRHRDDAVLDGRPNCRGWWRVAGVANHRSWFRRSCRNRYLID